MSAMEVSGHGRAVGTRQPLYDLLKGVAIFMVVMGHVLTMCIREIDAAFAFKFIGQVHMPIFFFISGYFSYKVTVGGDFARPNLKRRFMQLMVPFFVMSALWVWYFPHSHLESPLHLTLPGLYCSYWKDGYWFTLCLFELMVVYALLCPALRAMGRWWRPVLVVAVYGLLVVAARTMTIVADTVNVVLGLGLVVRFFPVFMMGVMARRCKERFVHLTVDGRVVAAAIIIAAVAFYLLVYPWDVPGLPPWFGVVGVPVFHAALIIVVMAVARPWSAWEYSARPRPSIVARYFNLLGRKSLAIYLCHYFFLFPMGFARPLAQATSLGLVPLVAIAAVTAFAIIAVTLLAVAVIERATPLARVMLGK